MGIDGEGVCYNDSGYVTLVRPRIAVMMSFGLTSHFTLRICDNKGSCSFEIAGVVPQGHAIELLRGEMEEVRFLSPVTAKGVKMILEYFTNNWTEKMSEAYTVKK